MRREHLTRHLLSSSLLLLSTISLTGCPFLGATSSAFDFKAVAVTSKKGGATTSTVRLTWDKHSEASLYKVYKTPQGGSKQLLNAVTELKYEDSDSVGATAAYLVEAVSSDGKTLATGTEKNLTVLASEVGQVSGLKVNDTEAGSSQVTIQSGSPKISWSTASKATAYYVTLQEVGSTTNVFSAFTADTAITVEDKLPLSSLSVPTFEQRSGTLVYGKNYLFSVAAVRTETNNLTAATAFDIAPAETNGKIIYFY